MAKVEYVVVGSWCAQLLWMRQTLKDYGYNMNHISLLYDKNLKSLKCKYF
jgi:hypothetical protein